MNNFSTLINTFRKRKILIQTMIFVYPQKKNTNLTLLRN